MSENIIALDIIEYRNGIKPYVQTFHSHNSMLHSTFSWNVPYGRIKVKVQVEAVGKIFVQWKI